MRLFTGIETLSLDARLGPLGTAVRRVESLESSGHTVLRWGLIGQDSSSVLAEFALADAPLPRPAFVNRPGNVGINAYAGELRTLIVIPTGVGATVGGFIADAGPFVRAVESVSSLTIVHPNVANGADFYAAGRDTLYVDGFTLDEFLLGRLRLCGASTRRLGIIVEPLPKHDHTKILNAANAVRAIYGIDIAAYDVLPRPLRARVRPSPYGHFVGEVEDPEEILESVARLQGVGVDAIAVITTCGGTTSLDWMAHYLRGGPNPIGGLEALISRFVTRATGITSAHAPARVADKAVEPLIVDPRAAGEVASGTGVPSVLLGLARAPRSSPDVGLAVEQLSAIIVPFGCAGGVPAWGAHKAGVPLLAVRSNTCSVGVTADQIGTGSPIIVETPAEALAWLVCTRAGVSWRDINAGAACIPPVTDITSEHPP